MKRKRYDLQLFAAQDGVITTTDIDVQAREIDFVTTFTRNIQQLLDILGISRPIEKANGTMLYRNTVTGTLKDGNVAEGEKVPFSNFKVQADPVGPLAIRKYAKAVTMESIAEHGYERAVTLADEEFKIQLQNVVLNDFYSFLLTGTLTSTEKDLQMAMSMAAGRVRHKFQKMGRQVTGIAEFVNTLDVYKYIGSANITVQTAFGMNYVQNFMGIDYLFFSSEIPQGTVAATPVNNIIPYYVNPANSEFSKAGLVYTVDPTLPMLGFHTKGDYDYVQSESYALMGIKLFAEYIDAVAVVTVDDTPTLGTLTVTSAEGTESGSTKITVSPEKEKTSNVYKYKLDTGAVSVTYGQNVRNWSTWDGESDITATSGQTITIVEADGSYQAQAAGSKAVTVKA